MNWLKSKFSGQTAEDQEMKDLAKYVKDPKLFEEYVKMKNDPEAKAYKDYVAKMKNVAESKKNMKIDMRPRVLVRTMTGEVILASVSLMAVIAMPVYFLKIRPVQLAGVQAKKEMKREEWVKEDDIQRKERERYIKENLHSDFSLSTQEKASLLTKEQRKEKIRRMEREYERDLLRAKREDRRASATQR